MANSEIKHIDLNSIGTSGSGVSIHGTKDKKSMKKMKAIGRKMTRKGVKGVIQKERKVRRGR